MTSDGKSRGIILALLLVAAVYLSTILLQPHGFWIVDNANKFLQVQTILNSNFSDFSLPWNGHSIDPEFRFNPLPSFSVVEEGRLYSIYSPFFAFISTGPYLLFGFHGLAAIPFISSLFLLAAVAGISRMTTTSDGTLVIAVLITALATPVWFYSTIFWEHVPAAAAGVWAVYFFLRANNENRLQFFAISGGLAAFACFFREEYALFALALILVLGPLCPRENRVRRVACFVFSAIVTMLPFLMFQLYATGHAFGFHVSSLVGSEKGIVSHLLSRWDVIYNLVLASHPDRWMSFLLTAPFLILICFKPRIGESSPAGFLFVLVLCLAIAASFAYLCFSWFNPRPALFLLESVNSFFVSAPLLALACWRSNLAPEDDVERSLRRIAILFLIFYCLAAPKLASRGIHWSNRFFLLAYPLLSVVAAQRLEKFWKIGRRSLLGIGVALILLSLVLQLYSIRLLFLKTGFSVAINEGIQNRQEEVVIFDVWWIPQELYSAFYEKAYFYVRSQQEYNSLVKRLSSHGIHTFLVVTQPKPGIEGKAYVDSKLGYFSLLFVKMSDVSGSP